MHNPEKKTRYKNAIRIAQRTTPRQLADPVHYNQHVDGKNRTSSVSRETRHHNPARNPPIRAGLGLG